MELAGRRELGGGRRWPQALPPLPPLQALPPLSLSAATFAATHAAASISTAPLLCLPLSDAVGISHPSLPPIAAAHAASVAAASIDRLHRSVPSPPLASPPLPKGEAARERERGIGLGYL
jgi:hypothetical protein